VCSSDLHRRPRQLRDDARPRDGRAAHLAHRRPSGSGLRRQPRRAPAQRRRPARSGAHPARHAGAGEAGGNDRREPAGPEGMTGRVRARAWAALLLAACVAAPATAQQSRDAERRLEAVRKEPREVASERRKLEGERGAAARRLRELDERVARSARALQATTAELERQQAALGELSERRDALRTRLSAQRGELRTLLRASYTAGDAAPLKLLLAQDQLADAGRALTYQRYLQRQRAARIAALAGELAGLEALERELAERRAELERAREAQQAQVAALERDRKARATALSDLEARYRDRN